VLPGIALVWKWFRDHTGGIQECRMQRHDIRVPHQMRKRGEGGFWLLFGIGGLLLLFWCSYMIRHAYYAIALMETGQPAMATVTTGGIPRQDCTYTFEVAGQAYRGRGPSSLRQGDNLKVLYEVGSPDVNRPADGLIWDIVWGVLMVIALALGMALAAPLRWQTSYRELQNADVQEKLRKADLVGAVEALQGSGSAHDDEEILG